MDLVAIGEAWRTTLQPDAIGNAWLYLLAALVGLAAVFTVAVRLTPCNPGMYWWKAPRAVLTDLFYWFVVPLFMQGCRRTMLIVGVALLFAGHDPDLLPVRGLPLWLQCVLILFVEDVLLFISHRLFHTRLGWNFHAVHHSPKVLDWMSTSRFHPVNLLLAGSGADIVMLLLGFDGRALLLLTPFNLFYSALVHANLNWTFGPLKYVFASPVFHRWHHTLQAEGLNKNFASTFPVLDLIGGTFYMPAGKLPENFGNGEADFPEGFWAQMAHPFRPRHFSGVLSRARRQPGRAAAVIVCGALGAGLLVAGGMHSAQLTKQNRLLAAELVQVKERQAWSEKARHAMQLDLAQRALMENDVARARAILEEAASTFQDSREQVNLLEMCKRKCLVLPGHLRTVTSVAMTADGQTVVTGGDDGLVKVWDGPSGQVKLTLKGHSLQVRGVAISGDGKTIVSSSYDQTVKVWDAQTGRPRRTLEGHNGAVLCVALSGDGKTIVSGGADMTARVWDAVSGAERFTFKDHVGAVLSVAASFDGGRIVSASWQTPKVWDGKSGKLLKTLEGHKDLVYSVAISPGGERILSGSFDESARVWDAETGRVELTLKGHSGPVFAVAFSADGKRIITGGRDRTVRVWDAAGHPRLTLKGHTDSVTSVAVSGDGRYILSGSTDRTAQVWDGPSCAYLDIVDLTRRDGEPVHPVRSGMTAEE
jgi:sterol desaturase/sphingolipid hydroxylase (fatty acid hydroxylase superfamily)